VPYIDALRVSARQLAARPPPTRIARCIFPLEDKLRAVYLQSVKLQARPRRSDAYLSQVVHADPRSASTPTARWARSSRSPICAASTSRSQRDEARGIYARWVKPRAPRFAEYKLLPGLPVPVHRRRVRPLHMAVHLHGMSAPAGLLQHRRRQSAAARADLHAKRFRTDQFVMLHGGWPYIHGSSVHCSRNRTLISTCRSNRLVIPAGNARRLAARVLEFPREGLFATDGYPFTDSLGWEDSGTSRAATSAMRSRFALSGPCCATARSRRARAGDRAGVLHDNAAKLLW